MSLLVWIFSMVGTFHCTFIMIAYIDLVEERGTGYSSLINNNNNDTVTRSNSNWPDHPIGVGLYSTSVYDLNANLLGCVSYYGTTDQFDGSFRAARAFGMMGALATTLGLIFVSLVTLFIEHITIKYSLWQMSRWLFFAAFICQLLTFLAFGRNICNRIDRECKPGPAAELSVFNLFLLCIQSALIYVVPAPNMPLFLLQKEKPMSIIEIGNDGFEINDKHQSSARKNQQQESNIRMENLSIEKSSSSISSQQQQQSPDDNSKNADLWRTGSDLESDDGNGNQEGLPQPVSIVMEGIECVEADHRRRHPKTKWQQFQEQYHKVGKHKGIW